MFQEHLFGPSEIYYLDLNVCEYYMYLVCRNDA
jgi:hypothetical protein